MSKITRYLNENLSGDIFAGDTIRKQFSTDGSLLSISPNLIVYPRTTDDIRRVARFAWRLAERGQVLPIIPRGNGTDQTGGAIGSGMILSFPAHMANIMEFDLKYKMVRVQAGINLETLCQAVSTHGLRLPVDGGRSRVMTVGGAQSINLAGRQYSKYGNIGDWTEKIEVVLSNGELIQTGKISKRELSEKKGLQTLEGEIYRSIYSLIEDNADLIDEIANRESLDGTVFPLDMVRGNGGSFDLTPLFLGSQGSLGVISQTILRLDDLPRDLAMAAIAFDKNDDIEEIGNKLLDLEPSSIQFIDGDTLSLIYEIGGLEPWSAITDRLPRALMFVEFDDKHAKKKLKKAEKILEEADVKDAVLATEMIDVDEIMNIQHSVAIVSNYSHKNIAAIPLATQIALPRGKIVDSIAEIRHFVRKNHIQAGLWGDFSSGLVSLYPLVELSNLGQRQSMIKILDSISELIIKIGGSICGSSSAGRFLTPWADAQHSKQIAELNDKVKKIFDPYGIINTGVGSGLEKSEVMSLLRQNYRDDRFFSYNLRG